MNRTRSTYLLVFAGTASQQLQVAALPAQTGASRPFRHPGELELFSQALALSCLARDSTLTMAERGNGIWEHCQKDGAHNSVPAMPDDDAKVADSGSGGTQDRLATLGLGRSSKPLELEDLLLELVLSKQDGAGLARCAQVCKSWADAVRDDRLWRNLVRAHQYVSRGICRSMLVWA